MSSENLSYPKEKLNVLLFEGIHQTAVDHFREAGYTSITHLSHSLQGPELHEAIAKAHIVGVRSRTKLTAEVLGHAKRLFAIGCFCIGTNQV
ncbi:MAG TPA: phosphoglycerate dehydrogenase, partial [Planctomycetes bacterium]|nr:phosphoglycerate dehydrogenase [Planctomycetota bacterium]